MKLWDTLYWIDNKLLANKIDVVKPKPEELKEAMELLNELVNVWFSKAKEQFVTAVKLGMLMPFSFAIKQKYEKEKGFLPWLFIYGVRDSGKTTTGEIVLNMFNVNDLNHKKGKGTIDTEAKLGNALSIDTFPQLINEGSQLFVKPSMNEMIKQAVEGFIARQRYENKNVLKEFPALASLIITANDKIPVNDEALTQKRLVMVRYPLEARADAEKVKDFKEKMSQRLPKLKALGDFIIYYIMNNQDILYNE